MDSVIIPTDGREVSEPLKEFAYTPLPDPTAYIRLLQFEIQSSSDMSFGVGEIHCTLTVWPLFGAPAYNAISYTWGNPEPTEILSLHGQPKRVRKNCADVLRQTRALAPSRYVWIDAVCIAQTCATEKSSQVKIMGQIFHRADMVLACIGIVENLDRALIMLDALHNARGLDSSYLMNDWCHDYVSKLGKRAVRKLYNDGMRLARRGYFQRLWVVQELILSRCTMICYGSRIIIPKLMAAMLWSLWSLRRWKPHVYSITRDPVWQQFENASALLDRNEYLDEEDLYKLKFRDAIHLSLFRSFEDPRDVVYSVLALIDWEEQRPITPDYSRSTFEILMQCFRLRLRDECDGGRASLTMTMGDFQMQRQECAEEIIAWTTNILPSPGEGYMGSLSNMRWIEAPACYRGRVLLLPGRLGGMAFRITSIPEYEDESPLPRPDTAWLHSLGLPQKALFLPELCLKEPKNAFRGTGTVTAFDARYAVTGWSYGSDLGCGLFLLEVDCWQRWYLVGWFGLEPYTITTT